MLKKEVCIGNRYIAKLSGRLTVVQILEVRTSRIKNRQKGWVAKNLRTGRQTHIKSAAKLRREYAGSQDPLYMKLGLSCERLEEAKKTADFHTLYKILKGAYRVHDIADLPGVSGAFRNPHGAGENIVEVIHTRHSSRLPDVVKDQFNGEILLQLK